MLVGHVVTCPLDTNANEAFKLWLGEFGDLVENSSEYVSFRDNYVQNIEDCYFRIGGFRGFGSVSLFLEDRKVSGDEAIDPDKVYNVLVCDGTDEGFELGTWCDPGLIF